MLTKALSLFLLPFFCGILLRLSAIQAIPFFSCEPQNARLLQLLSYVCNKTQTNIQIRDACYGCYFRAASLPGGVSQLIAVSQCSNIYLLNSSYTACAQDLAASTVGLKPLSTTILSSCSPGYCGFVRCLRRVNSVDLINTCFLANLINRDFNVVSNRIGFYTNTTACILARTRCGIVNPITGDIQRQNYSIQPDGITNSVGSAGYFNHNALQVSRNGDIKIVAFPTANVVGNALCSSDQSLDQSPYNLATCY